MFKIEKTRTILLNIFALVFVVLGVVLAGEITNNSDPDSTTAPYTLEDIYQKLTDPDYTTTPVHSLSPNGVTTDTNTMHSLDEIYAVIPDFKILDGSTTTIEAGIYDTTNLSEIETDLVDTNIASGTTMFGLIGTFVCEPPVE